MNESPMRGRADARRVLMAVTALALGVGLSGCVEEVANVSASASPTASARLAARPGVSPRGAPVAFASLEGAPDSVLSRFTRATQAAAESRDVAAVAPREAAYLARGYLTGYAVDGGVVIAAVWDIYDKGRRRVQRLEDYVVVKGAAADPWSVADDQTLAALAARSTDDLAATLTNMPEAIAAATRGPVVATDLPDETPKLPATASAFR
jgi:hypothetical protein